MRSHPSNKYNDRDRRVDTCNCHEMDFGVVQEVPMADHDRLYNRGLCDQHPIDAITGLKDELAKRPEMDPMTRPHNVLALDCKGRIEDVNIDVRDLVTKQTLGDSMSRGEFNDKNYIHKQRVASEVWGVNHNLGKMPSVTVVDSANRVVMGEINYIDFNNLTITFRGAFSGKAFIN